MSDKQDSQRQPARTMDRVADTMRDLCQQQFLVIRDLRAILDIDQARIKEAAKLLKRRDELLTKSEELDAKFMDLATLAGWYEFIADEQMKIFCKINPDSDKVMDVGLWAACRHPNYFGEISFWWGLFFFAIAADYSWWWTIAGPIAMVVLFIGISIPLIENKQLKKRPDYADYKRRVSMIIPWFPKE